VSDFPLHMIEGPITVTPTGAGCVSAVRCRCGEGFGGFEPGMIEANESALAKLREHVRSSATIEGEPSDG